MPAICVWIALRPSTSPETYARSDCICSLAQRATNWSARSAVSVRSSASSAMARITARGRPLPASSTSPGSALKPFLRSNGVAGDRVLGKRHVEWIGCAPTAASQLDAEKAIGPLLGQKPPFSMAEARTEKDDRRHRRWITPIERRYPVYRRHQLMSSNAHLRSRRSSCSPLAVATDLVCGCPASALRQLCTSCGT